MKPVVDHLVYVAPDLEMGVNALAELLGARAAAGGKHVGLGTHNALLGLGEGTHIEVIAPDPDQPRPERPLPFGLATVREPRLATFAVRTTDIDALVAAARNAGYNAGTPIDMSRTRPDGVTLKWRLAYHERMLGGGVIPFVIDWGDTPHPSAGRHARWPACSAPRTGLGPPVARGAPVPDGGDARQRTRHHRHDRGNRRPPDRAQLASFIHASRPRV